MKTQQSEIGIQRSPINVQRTPIIDETPCLEWDFVYEYLVNYIKFMSKKVADQYYTGAVLSSADLFQEGQLTLYKCYEAYKHKPFSEFRKLAKTSIGRRMTELAARSKKFITVNIEDAYDLGYTDDVVDDLYNEHKYQQLIQLLSEYPTALQIFKEFTEPSEKTIWESRMDTERKKMLRSQHKNVYVPQVIRIKPIFIRRSLGLTKKCFDDNLKIVKQYMTQVYGEGSDSLLIAM